MLMMRDDEMIGLLFIIYAAPLMLRQIIAPRDDTDMPLPFFTET